MSKPRNSLSRKISTILILLATPVFAVSLGSFFSHVQVLLHKEALERSNSILTTTMQHVVNYMGEVETAAKSNAWLLEKNFTPDSLQAISRRIVQLNGCLISCSVSTEPDVFSQYGRYFSVYTVNEGDTIITELESDFDYYNRMWYQKARLLGRACWVDPFIDFNQNEINNNDAVASYSIPLRPKGQKIAGVLSADFSFNRLAKTVINSEHPFPSAYYMLLSADGRYLIHPETKLLFKKTIFTNTDSIQHPDVIALGREMTAGKTGIMHVNKDDKLYHVCYAPVPNTNWSLAMVCLDEEILSDYNHLRHITIVVVIIGLLLILWITSKMVRHNMQPINQLLDATQRISEGNYEVPIPRSSRKDTFAQLQNTFSEMQNSIISYKEKNERTTKEILTESMHLKEAMQASMESAEEKDRFVQNLLRQIRMPLNVIEGLMAVLLRSRMVQNSHAATDNEQSTVAMRNITIALKHNAAQLVRMALMLSDSSRTISSDKIIYQADEQVPCNALAKECIEYLKDNYPDAEVIFETDLPDSVFIKSNHLYIMRTIREFLYNAAKYSDGKHIKLLITQTESIVRFIIEDKGPGLPQEWQDLFTQPFKKTTDFSEGLGLGLPLTMHHVENLGGKIIYDTDYQEGCRIIVEMPK